MQIPLFKPSIQRKDMDSVLTCMVNDTLSPDKENRELVKSMSKYLQVTGGEFFREPERALTTALQSLEPAAGGEIIISCLSPSWYIPAITRAGCVPVYCDVSTENGCMTAAEVEKAAGDKTAAIIVHYPLGFVPETEEINDLGYPVIEDIGESLGSNTGEKMAGSIGRFAVVVTEADHMITTAGGAALLAKNSRDVGKIRSVEDGIRADELLPDMNAALGIIQLKSIEKYIAARKGIASRYIDAAHRSRHTPFRQTGEAESVWCSFPIFLKTGLQDVKSYAQKKQIQTRPAFVDTVFEKYPNPDFPCPSGSELIMRTLLFPLYPTLGKRNVELVTKVLATLP